MNHGVDVHVIQSDRRFSWTKAAETCVCSQSVEQTDSSLCALSFLEAAELLHMHPVLDQHIHRTHRKFIEGEKWRVVEVTRRSHRKANIATY